uniref:Uncharacterized protein n=1 Tax=Populus trichocarpa TaxID=3694 RepID=A0A2K1WVR8_POPTR
MTASKRNIHGHGYPGLCSGKKWPTRKKGRALSCFNSTILLIVVVCTYSLYDKQVNGVSAWRTEQFIKPFLVVTPKIGREVLHK